MGETMDHVGKQGKILLDVIATKSFKYAPRATGGAVARAS